MHTFDFTADNGCWFPIDPNEGGNWVSGEGWQHVCSTSANFVRIRRIFPKTTITKFKVYFQTEAGSYASAGRPAAIRLFDDASLEEELLWQTTTETDSEELVGSWAVDTLDIRIWSSSGGCNGSVLVTAVEVEGTGDNPFAGFCREWCYEYDFLENDGGWTERSANEGEYATGVGWSAEGTTNRRLVINKTYTEPLAITAVEVDYSYTQGSGNPAYFGKRIGIFHTDTLLSQAPVPLTSGTAAWTGHYLTDKIEFNLWACIGTNCNNGAVTVTKIRVRGSGPNPFKPTFDINISSQTIYTYRAPITGNPTNVGDFPTSSTQADSYAIDPLTRHLWLHLSAAPGDWVRVAVATATVLKPVDCRWVEDATYTGADRIILPTASSGSLTLSVNAILDCIGNAAIAGSTGVANGSYTLPDLSNVPWPQTSTVTDSELAMFTHFPMSLAQICQGEIEAFPLYGMGCNTGAPYEGAPAEHPGFDVFGLSGSHVYSMAANGLIVGIGVGTTTGSYVERSAAR